MILTNDWNLRDGIQFALLIEREKPNGFITSGKNNHILKRVCQLNFPGSTIKLSFVLRKPVHPVEDIDLGVTRQEGRVILRVIARSPEISIKIMGQRWAETRIWLKACSYNHCYSRLVV